MNSEEKIQELMELVRLYGAAWFCSGIDNDKNTKRASEFELKAGHEKKSIESKLRELIKDDAQ